MAPMMTQSLPTWSSAASLKYPVQCHEPEEDPALLSGDDTDSDSEHGSETLSREDQQLLASFINLRKQRGFSAAPRQALRVDCTRAAPVLIPTQTRRYEPSSRDWTWDDDEAEDEREHCTCSACELGAGSAPAWEREPAAAAAAPSSGDADELIFDLEL